jgi:hypothetical protein
MAALPSQEVLEFIETFSADWAQRTRKLATPGFTAEDRKVIAKAALGCETWAAFADVTGVPRNTIRRRGMSDATSEAIVAAVNRCFRAKNEIAPEAYREWPRAPQTPSVWAFFDWLRDDGPHRSTALLPGKDDPDLEQRAPLEDILSFLDRSDMKPIMVVHQEGMTEGLRALARHLIYTSLATGLRKRRDVCYLAVNRHPTTHERITFPKLVGQLHAFFCTERQKLRPIPTPQDAGDLRRALNDIRQAMLERPAILILDGHTALRGAIPNLRALVADDALTALLPEILQPLVGGGASAGSPDRFNENRILVLADRPLLGFDAFCATTVELGAVPKEQLDGILRSQGRTHLSQLKALFAKGLTSDAALAVADTVIDLRLRNPQAATVLVNDLASPREAYAALAAQLKTDRPAALFALRLAALTEGGVRYATLVRLVDQWRKLAPAFVQTDGFALPFLSYSHTPGLLEVLRPILALGPDEHVRGLDDAAAPYGLIDQEDGDRAIGGDGRRPAFDLRSAQLRELILQQLADEDPSGRAFVLMHRLLAEEALRQQAHLMRHAEWRGHANPRYYRRQLQALMHGFASLSLGPRVDLPVSAEAPTVLPQKSVSAYRRLYAILYRNFLEHPPHFDLSRSLGRDRIKTEILLLAMNTGRRPAQIWSSLHGNGPAFTAARSAFLHEETETARSLAADQGLNLARSAFQADDGNLAKVAVDLAETALLEAATPSLVEEDLARARKMRIDCEMQDNPLLSGRIVKALEDRRWPAAAMADVRDLQKVPEGLCGTDVERDLEKRTRTFVEIHATRASATQLADWADLLGRLGEVEAIAADRRIRGATTDTSYFAKVLDRDQARHRAFVLFFVADALRRQAFDAQPLGRDYVVNAHLSRVYVRTSVQIARAFAWPDAPPDQVTLVGLAPRRFYLRTALTQLDLLTRYTARYTAERPSLLCLEATVIRSEGGFSRERLMTALKVLGEADVLMFSTPDRVRVRYRLMLERAKVLRALASAPSDTPGPDADQTQEACWRLAVMEIVRLWRLVEAGHQNDSKTVGLWQRLIAEQAAALRDFGEVWSLTTGLYDLDEDTLRSIPDPPLDPAGSSGSVVR